MSNHSTTYPPSKPVDEQPERSHVRSGLEEYERSTDGRPPWLLTTTELKLLGIAGVGFFLDGEDHLSLLFLITVLNFTYSQHTIFS